MILVGSHAAKFWDPNFRDPDDWDLTMSPEEYQIFITRFPPQKIIEGNIRKENYILFYEACRIEIVIARDGTDLQLLNGGEHMGWCVFPGLEPVKTYIATPEQLISMKRSHLYRPVKWYKNIKDYHYMKSLGWKTNPAWVKERMGEFEKLRVPSLNKSKAMFFKDKVNPIFDHDSVHEIVAHYDRPMYTRIQEGEVMCDYNLWQQLSHEDEVKCVQEEAYVIALERVFLPAYLENKHDVGPRGDWQFAYNWAVMRISTTLTSGFFRRFAVENWPKVMEHDHKIPFRFLKEYYTGNIKPIREFRI